MTFIHSWKEPPKTHDQLRQWIIYCRVWNDVGLQSPGCWIVQWMKMDYNEEPLVKDEVYDAWLRCQEAILHYVHECRE
jgi:hypothetical protein